MCIVKNFQMIPITPENKSWQGVYMGSDLQYIIMSKRLLSSTYKDLLKIKKKKMKRQMRSSKEVQMHKKH